MSEENTIRVTGNRLLVRFGETGTKEGLDLFDLDQHLSFKVVGNDLLAVAAGGDTAYSTVDTFANERQASAALSRVHRAIDRQLVREARHARMRSFVLYVAIPILLAALVWVLGLRSSPAPVVQTAAQVASGAAVQPQTVAPRAAQPAPAPAVASIPRVPAANIAKALKTGADSGKFAVRLGHAQGEAVYVFEDPLCPHCQAFAPELNRLAKTRPVYVFPVSVIGGAGSAKLNAEVLCKKDGTERVAGWRDAQLGQLQTTKPAAEECVDAAKANDQIFTMMGLRYTPTVFDANGRMMPANAPQTAAAINQWIKG